MRNKEVKGKCVENKKKYLEEELLYWAPLSFKRGAGGELGQG